jgi:lanosterol synthase
LREKIRFEMRTTDHTCLSPVSGLLSMIALWLEDPDDPDLARALERFEGWVWQDEVDGFRVTGARSLSWDSAFALQALAAAAPDRHRLRDVSRDRARQQALAHGSAFLATQQIGDSLAGHAEAFRIDPKGGWCFAGVWHGWPVSDCTAEAVSGILATGHRALEPQAAAAAARFILRCQNPDGGFGSYEPRRTRLDLERLNPAEMFGDSMTEASYTECTASAVAALVELREQYPELGDLDIGPKLARAAKRLEQRQNPDGSWPAAWGVHLIYGTLFGIVGLRAFGHPPAHPAIRRAQAWLLARQRDDGGWGEHHRSCIENRYIEAGRSQVIQTAWAMLALLRSECPMWPALDRGAAFLASRQDGDGGWPREQMAGVFFHTALLHYELYRSYFPVWALGLYRRRRMARPQTAGASAATARSTRARERIARAP